MDVIERGWETIVHLKHLKQKPIFLYSISKDETFNFQRRILSGLRKPFWLCLPFNRSYVPNISAKRYSSNSSHLHSQFSSSSIAHEREFTESFILSKNSRYLKKKDLTRIEHYVAVKFGSYERVMSNKNPYLSKSSLSGDFRHPVHISCSCLVAKLPIIWSWIFHSACMKLRIFSEKFPLRMCKFQREADTLIIWWRGVETTPYLTFHVRSNHKGNLSWCSTSWWCNLLFLGKQTFLCFLKTLTTKKRIKFDQKFQIEDYFKNLLHLRNLIDGISKSAIWLTSKIEDRKQ